MQSSDNCIFRYNNQAYTVVATLFTNTGDETRDLKAAFDIGDIEEIEYETKFNDLMVKGYLIYIDKYAIVDRAFNHHFCYLSLIFALNKKKTDNSTTIENIDEENMFEHIFFVNDIKVIERNAGIIKYKINFISTNWLKCAANLQYSNYGKEPEHIFEIVKNCITQQGLFVDQDSFDRVVADIKLNYITQLNDNLFSVIDYLMHKLYYYPSRDSSVKFLLYDIFNDNYRLVDLKDKNTLIGSFATIISFFKSSNENLIQSEPTNIGSLGETIHKIDVYKNSFEKDTFTYDFNNDEFNCDLSPDTEQVNYFNNKIDADTYLPKYSTLYPMPDLQFKDYGSYWNNTHAVYNHTVDMLEQNDAIVLNITGEIKRQPGSVTMITLDKNIDTMQHQRPSELKKMKQKYKAYEGVWIASKVRNIISPQNATFRQQLVLFRNFVPTYKNINEIETTADKEEELKKTQESAGKSREASIAQTKNNAIATNSTNNTTNNPFNDASHVRNKKKS